MYKSDRLGEHYYTVKHPSGLDVLIFPKKLSTFFAVFGTRFGSVNMRFTLDGKKCRLPAGTAHFLEHKMFENADGVNSDERFAALGAEDNAYTNYTATRYMFSATENIGECLSELLRFVTHPCFTEENVKKEQGIIEQEILMYRDDPYERAMENCLRAMYSSSGIRESICGSCASIKKITPEILYRAYNAFYRLDNMVLSVCGDISPEEVLEICDRELPSCANDAPPVVCEKPDEPDKVAKDRTVCRMNVSRPMFFAGVKDGVKVEGEAKLRRGLAMNILNNMLFSGTGEFYNRLLDSGLITPGFSFGYSSGDGFALNYFSGSSDAPEKVFELIKEKAFDACRGLDRDDFERCRRASLAQYVRSFDSTSDIADDVMLSAYYSDSDPFAIPGIIESLTFDEVASMPSELFQPDRFTLSLVLPL